MCPVPKVSAVLITYNEEKNLMMLLPRLSWCDEIVVLDSGSTDQTISICKTYNCTVFFRKFDGYGTQKKYAVSLAKNDWVLFLDADEIPSYELIKEILAELKNPSTVAYQIPMIFVFMGKKFRYGKESWRYFVRLFNRKVCDFSDDKVHEKVLCAGVPQKMEGSILHYSYKNFSQYFDKFNRYTSFGAEVAFIKGKKRSMVEVLLALPLNFFKYYFVERNFLNGWGGFYWSVFGAFYHFVKYLKLRELYLKTSKVEKNCSSDEGPSQPLLNDFNVFDYSSSN